MNKILSKLNLPTSNSKITHLRLTLPLFSQKVHKCIKEFDKVGPNSRAIFLSINGIEENPESCQILHDLVRLKYEHQKIPVYTFLEDRISALSYFIAAPSHRIFANPFCLMGDLALPHKRYQNIHALLEFLGIRVEKLNKRQIQVWQQLSDPMAQEQQITKRWLEAVQNNLKRSLKYRRSISDAHIEEFGHKLISPKKALELNIVDEIGTLEQAKQKYFPSCKINQVRISSKQSNPPFTKSQVQVFHEIKFLIQGNSGLMMSIEDPLGKCIEQIFEMIGSRLSNPQQLQGLDSMIGNFIAECKNQLSRVQLSI